MIEMDDDGGDGFGPRAREKEREDLASFSHSISSLMFLIMKNGLD